MRPNVTSVKLYLPQEMKMYQFNLREVLYRLRLKGFTNLTREEHSKFIADEYLLMLEEQKQKEIEKKQIYKKVSVLYRMCVPYKIDCYKAICDFLRYRYCKFKSTPERKPRHPYREEEGYWWNRIRKETGYYETCVADLNLGNIELYVLENHKSDFEDFIKKHHKSLYKHFKKRYVDYSNLAYNGVTEDF